MTNVTRLTLWSVAVADGAYLLLVLGGMFPDTIWTKVVLAFNLAVALANASLFYARRVHAWSQGKAVRPRNFIETARPILVGGVVVMLLGFAVMFVSPAIGAWIALPGMILVLGCGLLAFGGLFLSLFGKRAANG